MASRQQQIDQVVDTLTARWTSMGCAVWRVFGNPLRVVGPATPGGTGPWIGTERISRQVLEIAKQRIDADDTTPESLFPGGWLIPMPLRRQGSQFAWLMVLALESDSLHPGNVEPFCRVAGMSVEQGWDVLAPMTRHHHPSPHELQRLLQWNVDDLTQVTRDATVIEEFSERLIQSYEESNFLYRLARLLKWSASPAVSIEMSCRQIYEVMPFGWVVARFINDTSVTELAGKQLVVGQLPCNSERFECLVSEMMTNCSTDDWTALLTPENSDLAALVNSEIVAERITHDGRVFGLLLAGGKGGEASDVSSNEMQFFDAAAEFLGVFHENLSRFEEQKSLFLGTVQALTSSIDAKDKYTCGHSERVAMLGSQLAAAIGMDSDDVERIRIAGLVHDVGKIGIPEAVLSKPGKLTNAEFELIKQHPVIGHQILKDIPPLAPMLPGVLYHHERWDGRGYPEGLEGEKIPIYGRLLACADTFDAMSSTRAYRPAMPRGKVLAEVHACAGTQFDPDLVDPFTSLDFGPYDEMVDRHSAASASYAA